MLPGLEKRSTVTFLTGTGLKSALDAWLWMVALRSPSSYGTLFHDHLCQIEHRAISISTVPRRR